MYVQIDKSGKSNHCLDFTIDPAHTQILTEPMLSFCIYKILKSGHTNQNVLITVCSNSEVHTILKSRGFIEIETNHILDLKSIPDF